MFLTGEFSKISRVSKRLLYYYNNIGLLRPAYVDEATGYHYYRARQLPRLNRILALKDLGLSLDQIRKMLQAEISDDEINGMLLMKKAEVEQTMREDMQRLRLIEARLQQNQRAEDRTDVVIKSVPSQPFLSIRTVFTTPEETMQLIEQLLHTIPANVGPGILGPFTGVFYSDGFTLTNNDVDLGYLLKKTVKTSIPITEDLVLRSHHLPPVETMATSVQDGGSDPVLLALGNIAQWIEEHGYRMAGPYREICFDMFSLSDFEEAVIEIQVPVEKASSLPALSPNLPD